MDKEKGMRMEYPRPQFVRTDWMSLNGVWDFAFDEEVYDQTINVPFVYEAKLSGIDKREIHDQVWYRRTFEIPENWKGKRVILHFGAVDYACQVFVNSKNVMRHVGGQSSFSVDITEDLEARENELKLCVRDFHRELDIVRGKQFWKEESESIFYIASMGIWQSVWLEPVSREYIRQVHITPLLDEKAVRFSYETEQAQECVLETTVSFGGIEAGSFSVRLNHAKGEFAIRIDEETLGCWNTVEDLVWSPENPRLFDVTFTLKKDGSTVDCVRSYFGMRKVSIENGKFLLNNRPYYQKLVLDQGFWPEGLLTAPSDEALIRDIQLAKEMGFNGVRKHQKVEDPRFLYHADRLGLLVWGEMASGYRYSDRLIEDTVNEWMREIERDYNHPCIVVWTALNESWGVLEVAHSRKQQNFCKAMYSLIKSLDGTRAVIDNDGWEHVEIDLLTIHDYEPEREVLMERYSSMERILRERPGGRGLYTSAGRYRNEPVLVTEFGGISFQKNTMEGWGYSAAVSEEDFVRRYRDVVQSLLESEWVQGFCYTQLTDVEQEINGLYTYDRNPKIDPEQIRRINEGDVR